jgi:mycoredoxin
MLSRQFPMKENIQMSQPALKVYATDWCFDCRRVRQLLTEVNIPFEWIDIDRDKQAEQYVIQVNQGMRSVPTLLFPDGSTLTEPSKAQLCQKLGLAPATPSCR